MFCSKPSGLESQNINVQFYWKKSYFKSTFDRIRITFFFLDFFFFSGVVFVVLSIEAIDGVLIEGTKSPELA